MVREELIEDLVDLIQNTIAGIDRLSLFSSNMYRPVLRNKLNNIFSKYGELGLINGT